MITMIDELKVVIQNLKLINLLVIVLINSQNLESDVLYFPFKCGGVKEKYTKYEYFKIVLLSECTLIKVFCMFSQYLFLCIYCCHGQRSL